MYARRAYRVWSELIPVFALCIALYAVIEVEGTVNSIQQEGVDRRDQTCVVFERDAIAAKVSYVNARDQLGQTEEYLSNLTPEDKNSSINVAVAANLPRLKNAVDQRWREARAAKAPDYCDLPGVGLHEPNPVLPARPR